MLVSGRVPYSNYGGIFFCCSIPTEWEDLQKTPPRSLLDGDVGALRHLEASYPFAMTIFDLAVAGL